LDHAHLLGTRRYLDQLLLAIRKVNDHLAQVKALRKKRGAGK